MHSPQELFVFILIGFFLFLVGAIIGSFLHVLATRGKIGKSWISGRSECDICHKKLRWFDMVPVLSFILLGGKCRFCNKKIATRHLLYEITFGIVAVIWMGVAMYFYAPLDSLVTILQVLYWFLVLMVLGYIALVDFEEFIIPDGSVVILVGSALLSLGYRSIVAQEGIQDLVWSFMIAIVVTFGMFLLWYLTKGRGLGFGDVKLVLPLSLIVGWPGALVGVFLSFLIGAVVGVGLICVKKHAWKQPIPFGPFLILGFLLSVLFGSEIWGWYIQFLR